jgi:hypothetical protein
MGGGCDNQAQRQTLKSSDDRAERPKGSVITAYKVKYSIPDSSESLHIPLKYGDTKKEIQIFDCANVQLKNDMRLF